MTPPDERGTSAGGRRADLDALLVSTAADVCRAAQAAACCISRLEGDAATMLATQGREAYAGRPAGAVWRLTDLPPARQAVATRRPVFVMSTDDPRLPASVRERHYGSSALRCFAYVPLTSGSSTVGLLELSDVRPRDFGPAVAALGSLTQLLGAVLEQTARLSQLRRTSEDLTLVLQADIEAQSGPTGPEQVLQIIAHRMAELCKASAVDILAVEDEALRTLVSWAHGSFRPDATGQVLSLRDWPLSRASINGMSVTVAVDCADTLLTPTAVSLLGQRGLASTMSVPLVTHARVIGLVHVHDAERRDYAEVMAPATALAQVAAHILEKALLLEALEQRNRTLREIVELGAHVNQSADPAALAHFVARRLVDVLGVVCCEVFRHDDRRLVCLASVDTRPEMQDPDLSKPVDLEQFPSLTRAIRAHDVLVIASREDPRLTAGEHEIFRRWRFESEVSVPLLIEDRLVGMIDIFDDRPREYAEHLDFLRSVGQIVAGAFDTILLMARLADSNEELRLLVDSGLEFGSTLDLDEILRSVATRMCTVVDAACCDIYAVDAERIVGLLSVENGTADEDFPGTSYARRDFPVVERAINAARPISVADVTTDPLVGEVEREEDLRYGFRSLLEIPLINRGQVVGVAAVFAHEPREWGRMDLLQGLAQIAAQALANAGIHLEVDRNAEHLRLLNETSLELASTISLDRILEITARRLCEAAGAASCLIATVEDGRLKHRTRAGSACPRPPLPDEAVLADRSLARLAVDTCRVVAVPTAGDPRLTDDERRTMAAAGYRSGLLVPLLREQRVIGLAEIYDCERERTYDHDVVDLLQSVCRVAALALANAELYQSLEERNRESELLSTIAEKAGASLDMAAVARAAVEELAAFIQFDHAFVVTDTQSGVGYRVLHCTQPGLGHLLEQGPQSVDTAFVARLEEEGVVVVDAASSPFGAASGELGDLRSGIIVSLRYEDQPRGALGLLSLRERAFDRVDRDLLTRVGAQLGLALNNASLYETIRGMHLSNLTALISALNARDYYAVGHAARVASYILLLGRELGWPNERLGRITEAAFLHDVGRIGVGDDVLFKPGALTEAELEELRQHPVTSAQILQPLFDEELVVAVRHHHEHWNGGGYPDGFAGEAIPELARALALVDAYDAMSFRRPHHEALTYAECLAEMDRCRGTQFDPDMVTAFMRVLDRLDERRSLAQAAAEEAVARLDASVVREVLASHDERAPAYASLASLLRDVRDGHPGVRFLTALAMGHDGWQIICDPEEDPEMRSRPGDRADGLANTGVRDFGEQNVLELDDYGVWVSGIVPVPDLGEETPALMCADMTPDDDWPASLGRPSAGAAETFAAIIDSATDRLGRARVDAVTDGLTGLYNQRYFKQRLAEEVARASEQGRPLSLLFCDLDHFKRYNDRHGHTAGDQALRAVAGALLGCIRQVDLAARYGGEEFTVILLDTPPERAVDVAERIRTAVRDDAGAEAPSPLSVSIGLASYPRDAQVVEELLDKADWAMYLAKRQGRDRVVQFAPHAEDDAPLRPSPG